MQACLRAAGHYLEIFGRKNNLRNHWVTIGNEVTGTGLPKEDVAWLKDHTRVPNAVFGHVSSRGR
jgi:mRNA (2'-O-methyladenosine-N6-)-methyltransferase